MAPANKKMAPANKKKTGPKLNSKNNNAKTRLDWFKVCDDYKNNSFTIKSKIKWLASDWTDPKFTGTESERKSFERYLKQYTAGKLTAVDADTKRAAKPAYPQIEDKLHAYIQLRAKKYTMDKCGLSWMAVQAKALAIAEKMDVDVAKFKASPGWISKFLKRKNLEGIKLHGEAGDMEPAERERIMRDWRNGTFKDAMEWLSEENDDIVWQMKRIYNADQTGLFYQKLPNRIYVDKDLKKDCAGAKQMKDKTRITLMVCTSAHGEKVPLSLVGKAKNPRCFDHLDNPPMAYKDQKNAWFDQKITIWWIFQVFILHHTHHHGRSKAILLLDNCTAHKINMEFLPDWLKIVFLPPNVTNTHQPADMGIIASLKVGYKTSMLMQLLEIFDREGGYEEAARLRQSTRKGCRGLRLGGKATVLDAMHILDEIWKKDARYAKVEGIRRCWRKANILPVAMETLINQEVGSGSGTDSEKVLSNVDCKELCEIMNKLQVKTRATGLNTDTDGYGLQNSFADEKKLTVEEMIIMAESWVDIEDQPMVENACVDDEMELEESEMEVENEPKDDDDDEPETKPPAIDDKQKIPLSQAENLIFDLKQSYPEGFDELDKFIRKIRNEKGKKPKEQRTLHSFGFAKKGNSDDMCNL